MQQQNGPPCEGGPSGVSLDQSDPRSELAGKQAQDAPPTAGVADGPRATAASDASAPPGHNDDLGPPSHNVIEQIRNALPEKERQVLADDRSRWGRMKAGAHLEDYLAFGPGCLIRRREAMRLAFTNRPEGKAYVLAYRQLLAADGIDTSEKMTMNAFTDVLWLHEDPERMRILRELLVGMTAGERARFNVPNSARRRVADIIKARAGGQQQQDRVSPLTKLKRRNAELEHELAAAQQRLQRSDTSRFDLHLDTAADIAEQIAIHLSESKARDIAKRIPEAINKKKRSNQCPAG